MVGHTQKLNAQYEIDHLSNRQFAHCEEPNPNAYFNRHREPNPDHLQVVVLREHCRLRKLTRNKNYRSPLPKFKIYKDPWFANPHPQKALYSMIHVSGGWSQTVYQKLPLEL